MLVFFVVYVVLAMQCDGPVVVDRVLFLEGALKK